MFFNKCRCCDTDYYDNSKRYTDKMFEDAKEYNRCNICEQLMDFIKYCAYQPYMCTGCSLGRTFLTKIHVPQKQVGLDWKTIRDRSMIMQNEYDKLGRLYDIS